MDALTPAGPALGDSSLADAVRAVDGLYDIPLPGSGSTPRRHQILTEFGCRDLSLARIVEGHADALAILAESGRVAVPGSLYAVWASEGPNSRVQAEQLPDGRWSLQGTKQYCSGAPFVTQALITAQSGESVLLFDVPLATPNVHILPSPWATAAMLDTATGPVAFNRVSVGRDQQVGSCDWYLERPGFWHGSLGPAACWAGGAWSLVQAAVALNRRDPHSRAHVGAMLAARWGMEAALTQAGREIDADPVGSLLSARRRGLMCRHLIERWCTEILDRFGRATGPQLLVYDRQIARQHAALSVYLRQCHAERDLEAIPANDVH